MTFKKYPKIHRLGKEETEGILDGVCYIEEKLDGANASIWIDKRGEITCGSRNRELSEGFNGLVDYVKENEPINNLLKDNPQLRLYGEWLVPHTIKYDETSYRKFYLFDITEVSDGEEEEQYLEKSHTRGLAAEYGIPVPEFHGQIENPTMEQLNEFVGKTTLGAKGEGIVIRNPWFIDKFGIQRHAKIVSEAFKEDNVVTFGGNNKHSDTYWEMYITNKYMTLPRIQKIMNKIQPLVDKNLDFEHTPRIIHTAYHDLLEEEIWEIAGKVGVVDFKALKRISSKKAARIYKDILNEHISVAYK